MLSYICEYDEGWLPLWTNHKHSNSRGKMEATNHVFSVARLSLAVFSYASQRRFVSLKSAAKRCYDMIRLAALRNHAMTRLAMRCYPALISVVLRSAMLSYARVRYAMVCYDWPCVSMRAMLSYARLSLA